MVNITRNELVAITNVIEKLPQSYIGGTETENDQGISFSVVEDTLQEPPRGNPEEDQHATNSGPNISHSEQELDEAPVICNKRPRPRYSLKRPMLRKHPVTAACPYPALRLDKLYAALIRCLVLWTVTKQFLVSCFKGLYL